MSVEEKERIERDDIEWVMSTVQGRRCMWRILSHCGIYHSMEGDVPQILKQEGKRQAGLFLLGIISDAAEDRLFDMMKEAKTRTLEEKIKNDNSNSNTTSGTGSNYNDSVSALDSLIGSGYSSDYTLSDGGPVF